MRSKKFSIGLTALSAIFAVTLFMTATRAVAQREKVLHSFSLSDGGGDDPQAGLIFDPAGNLYGTTGFGGTYNCGTVFELTSAVGGGWTETVLHSFNNNGTDGCYPQSSGLTFDAAGNLYGTTYKGGTYGFGTVFALTPAVGGGWTEAVVHNFNNNGVDGYEPFATSLIFDATGNLYGTTEYGGTYNYGTVFELMPAGGGGWTETVLHSFNHTDGANPFGGLIFDATGNLFGTTSEGGAQFGGTVFELAPKAGGGWTERVLYSFGAINGGQDGRNPGAGLIFDAAGRLYGTTYFGGAYTYGTVFELSRKPGGGWTDTVLHSFNKNGTDGYYPDAGLIFDASGNLYGTTQYGGAYDFGAVFELRPKAGGAEKVLHSFHPYNGLDAIVPTAGLIFDAAGNLYGTTTGGGANDAGAVFEVRP